MTIAEASRKDSESITIGERTRGGMFQITRRTTTLFGISLALLLTPPAVAQNAVPPLPSSTEKASGFVGRFHSEKAEISLIRLNLSRFDFQIDSSSQTANPSADSLFPYTFHYSPNRGSYINQMESAFYCNDTPFVDQVRLPFASLWGGRLRVVAFESDVATANFVLGLPGGGTLKSLSMFGSGHLATHTPPSDQLVGMNMTLHLGGSPQENHDNSGLRGLRYVVRTSREFLSNFSVPW